jgi:amidophosphoribosyltransferase
MLYDAGAKEVHVRISSPPILHSCFYGIDTPTKNELIGSTHTVEKIREYLNADSLSYLSQEKMMSVVENGQSEFCSACFDGNYHVPLSDKEIETSQLGLFNEK